MSVSLFYAVSLDYLLSVCVGSVTNQDMTLLDEKPATEQIELKGYLNK